jgi:hypothetical protein
VAFLPVDHLTCFLQWHIIVVKLTVKSGYTAAILKSSRDDPKPAQRKASPANRLQKIIENDPSVDFPRLLVSKRSNFTD